MIPVSEVAPVHPRPLCVVLLGALFVGACGGATAPRGRQDASEARPLTQEEWAAVLPQERIRIGKNDRIVRRQAPDGVVLAPDVIDLGSQEGAFAGLRLRAYEYRHAQPGKSRVRVNKGTVEVVEVLGPHKSRIRVLSQDEPIVRGDLVFNPLFGAHEPLHVWLHESLDHARIAAGLRRMNAVVDAEIDGNTDFIVVPDGWLRLEAEDADEEATHVTEGEVEARRWLRTMARTFAVRIISVTDLSRFVDF